MQKHDVLLLSEAGVTQLRAFVRTSCSCFHFLAFSWHLFVWGGGCSYWSWKQGKNSPRMLFSCGQNKTDMLSCVTSCSCREKDVASSAFRHTHHTLHTPIIRSVNPSEHDDVILFVSSWSPDEAKLCLSSQFNKFFRQSKQCCCCRSSSELQTLRTLMCLRGADDGPAR